MKATIPTSLQTPSFIEAWDNWLADRRERRRPVTTRAATLQLRKLEAMGPVAAVASINQSIERGYQGIFEVAAPRDTKNLEPKPTVYGLTKRIEAIDAEMKQLRRTGGSEVASGFQWDNEAKAAEHKRLRLLRGELNKQLVNL